MMIHPCLYNLVCVHGVLMRCYGRSRFPRITRLKPSKHWSHKVEVHLSNGYLIPEYWSLFRL